MTQLSSNTLTYDQIYIKIREFYVKELKGDFSSNQERLEEYKKLLSDIYENINGPTTKFDPYIKGEPPMSEKFNKFSTSLGNDISLASKQVDYLNAKAVNAFNVFNSELESEKKYLERIASKAKILQMYSKAPAEDLIYVGDSFENADYIDVTKIPVGLMPSIANGSLTLPIARSRPWVTKRITIDNKESNGFIGNNHQVIKDLNPSNSSEYDYLYQSNRSLSSLSSITDSSPLTYFEYEGLNVDKATSNPPSPLNLRSENEFCYIVDKKTINNVTEGSLVNWSNFDMANPLRLKLTLENTSAPMANSIKINPYFGSTKLIKIISITAHKQNGDKVELINSPIFIGTSLVPVNVSSLKNYFYNEATVRFSDLKVIKFDFVFEQDLHEEMLIKHGFFRPSFNAGSGQNNPFYGLPRFNPRALSSSEYKNIEYDDNKLLPSSYQPNQFKEFEAYSETVQVRLTKERTTYKEYAITLDGKRQFTDNDVVFYYYNGVYDDTESVIESFNLVDNLPNLFAPDSQAYELLGNRKTFASLDEGQLEFSRLIDYLDANYYNEDTDEYTIVLNSVYYTFPRDGVYIKYVEYNSTETPRTYSVPVVMDYELYQAKRKAIGIRDISINYETYADRAQMVSKPFYFESPVESLMLSVDSTYDNTFSDDFEIQYFISVNDSSWISLSPIQLASTGTAEVLVFNKNIPVNYQIPGVGYLNYPKVPSEINKIVVRFDIAKKRLSNITPSIFAYQLMTKVKRQ